MGVLKGNKTFYEYEASDIVGENIKRWLEYGLLELGAYTVVSFDNPTSGYTNLKRVKDESFGGTGRVYEGLGPSWVWESGVSIPSGYPSIFRASGVRINSTFFPTETTTGTFAHKIDFRNGRVIFDAAIPAGSSVKCEYVMRDVDVFLHDEPKWKTIVNEYLSRFSSLDTLSPSGMAAVLKTRRIWLPTVVVEPFSSSKAPLQLGGGEIQSFDIEFHIFADRPFDNKRIIDTLTNQFETVLDLYDINEAPPQYNNNGTVHSGALPYPTLGDRNGQYFWTFGFIETVNGDAIESSTDVYRGEVTYNVRVDRHLSTY
jgi:hypothetical protein